jgi:uncharacterized protein (TIGR00369 family)
MFARATETDEGRRSMTLAIEPAQAILDANVSPWVKELGMRVEGVDEGGVRIRVPFQDRFVHSGGVVCGQVLMSVADAGTMLAINCARGEPVPMATVTLSTSFMRGVTSDLVAEVRILRAGRTMVFAEIAMRDAEDRLAGHATATYMLLARNSGR